MRYVADFAVLCRLMDQFERQHLARVAAETIVISRLYACMRFVALIAVEPRHGHSVGEFRF